MTQNEQIFTIIIDIWKIVALLKTNNGVLRIRLTEDLIPADDTLLIGLTPEYFILSPQAIVREIYP